MATERWTDEMLDKLTESVNSTKQTVESMAESIKQQSAESKELGIRFNAYQQASQWVVNLAFGLLATATVTTIITAIFRK
jgi:hypothetical protein